MSERPCRYCVAAWAEMSTRHGGPGVAPEVQDCEFEHERNDQPLYDLATALARVFQGTRTPTDAQIGWFLGDAEEVLEEVLDDLPAVPDTWRVRRLPESANDAEQGIDARIRINDVTYVALEGGKDTKGAVVKLSTFRSWGR